MQSINAGKNRRSSIFWRKMMGSRVQMVHQRCLMDILCGNVQQGASVETQHSREETWSAKLCLLTLEALSAAEITKREDVKRERGELTPEKRSSMKGQGKPDTRVKRSRPVNFGILGESLNRMQKYSLYYFTDSDYRNLIQVQSCFPVLSWHSSFKYFFLRHNQSC